MLRDWLIITQYYHPEPGAPQVRLRALVDSPKMRESYSKAGIKLVGRESSWRSIVLNWLDQVETNSLSREAIGYAKYGEFLLSAFIYLALPSL